METTILEHAYTCSSVSIILLYGSLYWALPIAKLPIYMQMQNSQVAIQRNITIRKLDKSTNL